MKHRLPQILGHNTRLCMLRKRGRQFSGFAVRCGRDPVTRELCCTLRWPGGLLFIGLAHTVAGLCG